MLQWYGATGVIVLTTALLAAVSGLTALKWAAIGVMLGAFVLIGWLRRSLPIRSGTLSLTGLWEPVEVYRDSRGIPHIFARNPHDLYMAQGYVTAEDRLWSMDVDRMVASGRLAELFGPTWLSLDRHFRNLGLRRAATDSLAAYSPDSREWLEAYARGINARMAQGRLPAEFVLNGRRPEPWTPVDTLTLSKYTAYGLSGNWESELFRANLVHSLGAEKAAHLFWQVPDPKSLHHLEEHPLPDLTEALSVAALTLNATAGSNCWAVSGSRTESGAAMLANDPHLALRIPSPWYQTHLVCQNSIDVVGVTFPGIPGIMTGQNRSMAWGITTLSADTQDLYLEQIHPDVPHQYRHGDSWEKAVRYREQIRVRGQKEPVSHEVLVTRHGPLIARGDQTALALRWTALAPTAELETFFGINQASSWIEFKAALRHYSVPPLNFMYADRQGNIGWKASGKIPIRASGDGQAPAPGWSDIGEWTGFIPFEQLPEVFNPPEGYLVNANQEIQADDLPFMLGSSWAPSYRADRITQRLRGASGLTAKQMRAIQADEVSLQARSLLQPLLAAVHEGIRQAPQVEALSEPEKAALLLISGWEGSEEAHRPEPALWHQWYLFLVEGIFRPQMGLTLFDQFASCGLPVSVADRLLRQVAEGGENPWLPREGESGLSRIALQAFRRAVALLTAKQGKKPERWQWGREHQALFHHPLSRCGSPLRLFLNIGSYPVGGSTVTVNSQGYSQVHPFKVTFAPLWRQVVDLGRMEESTHILAPGQCGHFLSPHYGDQMAPWLRGEQLPQRPTTETIRAFPCLTLRPGGQSGSGS